MKPLIIVDYSHTVMRMVFVAIAQAKPKKKQGKFITSEYMPYMKYLLFNSLQFVKNKFNGDMVLAIDSKMNWRRDLYSDYKANRAKAKTDSGIDFDEFFGEVDKITDVIREMFPFKVVKVPKSEADDIAGTISLVYGNDRTIVLVTSDHDWSQVLSHTNTQMWDPIKKEFANLTDFENTIIETDFGNMSRFTIIHSLIGDKGDNVPTITGMTEFSDAFKSYLKENNIVNTSVKDFNSMGIKDELIENFNVYKITKSGANKGKQTEEKDVYKTVPFGIKKAEKAAENVDSLNGLLNSHPMYRDNFIRNRTLVDFDCVPENIKRDILDEFERVEINYDPNKMLEYFMQENLGQHINNIHKFHDTSLEKQTSTSLDDFF